VGVSQGDREHSVIGCEVVHYCDVVVTRITLYHIFQDLLMARSSLAAQKSELKLSTISGNQNPAI
jgi:hypothetical protein